MRHRAAAALILWTLGIATPANAQPAAAGAESRSSGDSLAAAVGERRWIEIRLEGGQVLTAREVRPLANGLIRVSVPGQGASTVSASRVREIRDDRDRDRTLDVLERNRAVSVGDKGPRPPEPAWEPFRFRGAPASRCDYFAITEYSYLRRLDGGGDVKADEHTYVSFDLGVMRNLGSANALGASVFAGVDGQRSHYGVRARFREWLSPRVSLGLAPGLILWGDEEGVSSFRGPGFIGRVDLMVSDLGGITAQVFRVDRRVPANLTISGSETAWQGGLALGSRPGVAALLLTAGVVLMAAGSLR